MKQTKTELNLFPVYETTEAIKLVVPSGMLQVKTDKKSRVILKGHPEAIALIDEYYTRYSSDSREGHTGFFDNGEFIFPSDHSFRVEEVGTNGKLVRIIIYSRRLKGFESKIFSDKKDLSPDLPFERDYILKKVDSLPIGFAYTE